MEDPLLFQIVMFYILVLLFFEGELFNYGLLIVDSY